MERRRHKRHPIQADVLVVPKNSEQDHFWAVTENISAGGMFVRTERKLPIYAEIQVKIFPEKGFVVNAVASVVHASEKGFGCCFAYIPHQSKNYLDRWLGRSGGLKEVSGTIREPPAD